MRLDDLAVFVLQQIRAIAVQHARTSADQRRRVTARLDTVAGRFDADQLHGFVFDIRIKDAHRVRTAANARDHRVRLAAGQFGHLHLAFVADHALEVAHHHRVRMRSRHRADDVERVFDVGHPVAHGFVQRVFQRREPDSTGTTVAPSSFMRYTFAACRRTSSDAHVDHAFHAETRGDGRRGDAVLAGAGFRDHARLAHACREQRLADHVVDLVRAGVIQVFALEKICAPPSISLQRFA